MAVAEKIWRSEVVDTEDRFSNLQNQWQALQQSLIDPQSSPFLSWDWLYLWWTIYRRPHWRLSIGLIWCDEKLVAIFPFYIKHSLLRQLHFLGTGETEAEEVATEYLDCLIDADGDGDVGTRQYASQWLAGFLDDMDVVVFERICESATISKFFLESHLFPVLYKKECGRRYCLQLQDYSKQFATNLKRKHRKYQKTLDAGQWQMECCSSVKQLDSYFSELKRLHELRWQSKGKSGAFSSAKFLQFHRAFAEAMLQKGRLYLGLLQINNEVVGGLYAVDGDHVRYFYQAGFLPAMQQWAPGHLGHFLAIDSACGKGYSHYDFMLGAEAGSYKRQYTPPGELIISLVAAKKKWQMLTYQFSNKWLSFWS